MNFARQDMSFKLLLFLGHSLLVGFRFLEVSSPVPKLRLVWLLMRGICLSFFLLFFYESFVYTFPTSHKSPWRYATTTRAGK